MAAPVLVGTSVVVAGSTSVAPTFPANIVAGTALCLFVTAKPETITLPTISGWALIVDQAVGSGTAGTSVGPQRLGVYHRDADGTEASGATVTVTPATGTANVMLAGISAWNPATAGYVIETNASYGSDTTAAANLSVTKVGADRETAGDIMLFGMASTANSNMGSTTVSATGATYGTVSEMTDVGSNTGNRGRLSILQRPVTAGTATAASVAVSTITATVTGGAAFIRLREVPGVADYTGPSTVTAVTATVSAEGVANHSDGGTFTVTATVSSAGTAAGDFTGPSTVTAVTATGSAVIASTGASTALAVTATIPTSDGTVGGNTGTPTLVQRLWTTGPSARPLTASWTSPVVDVTTTVGTELVIALGTRLSVTPTGVTVTDTAGNTWAVSTYISGTLTVTVAHTPCTVALRSGIDTVTVAAVGGATLSAVALQGYEWSGLTDTVNASRSTGAGTGTTLTGSAMTPGAASDLAFVVLYNKGSITTETINSDTGLGGTDDTQVGTTGTACTIRPSWKALSSAAAITPTATQATSVAWGVLGVTMPAAVVSNDLTGASTALAVTATHTAAGSANLSGPSTALAVTATIPTSSGTFGGGAVTGPSTTLAVTATLTGDGDVPVTAQRFANNCEGAVAPGTNWTTANQGASGDAFTVTRTAGTIYTTTTAGEVIHDSQSVEFTPGAAGVTHRLAWTLTDGQSANARGYFRLPAAPTADAQLITLQGSGGQCANAKLSATTSRIRMENAAGSTPTGGSPTTALTYPAVYGFDLTCTPGTDTTNGTGRLVVYNEDGSTFADTGDITSNFYRTGVVLEIRFGVAVNYTVIGDSFVGSDQYELAGPVSTSGDFTGGSTTLAVTAGGLAAAAVTDVIGLGVVGDSQVWQDGDGNGDGGLVESNLVTYGAWDATHVSVDGLVGRSIIGTAVLPSAPQVIDGWRADGFDPRTWLILLGGNGIHEVLSSQKSYINALLDVIVNSTTGVYRVYWGNVVRQDTSDTEVDRFWQALTEVQAVRTDCDFRVFDLDSMIHNGRDETGLWQADGVHMTTAGYVIRNQLVGTAVTLADYAGAVTRPVTATVTAGGAVTWSGPSTTTAVTATRATVGGALGASTSLPVTATRVAAGSVPWSGPSTSTAVTATRPAVGGALGASTTRAVTATVTAGAAVTWSGPSTVVAVTATRPGVGAATGISTTAAVTATLTAGGTVPRSSGSTATAVTATLTAAASGDFTGPSTPTAVTATVSGEGLTEQGFAQVSGTILTIGGPWTMHSATVYGQLDTPDAIVAAAVTAKLNCLELNEYEKVWRNLASTMSEATWTRIDTIIDRARTAGLKIMLNFSSYGQTLMANGIKPTTYDWGTYVSFVMNRVNTVTGVRYRDDRTIVKIELYGEIDAPNYSVPLRGTTQETTDFFNRTLRQLRAVTPYHVISSGGFSYLNDSGCGIDWQTIMADPYNQTCDIELNSIPDRDISIPAVATYAGTLGKPWFLAAFSGCQGTPTSDHDLNHYPDDASAAAHFNDCYLLARGLVVPTGTPHTPALGSSFWNLGPSGSCEISSSVPLTLGRVQAWAPRDDLLPVRAIATAGGTVTDGITGGATPVAVTATVSAGGVTARSSGSTTLAVTAGQVTTGAALGVSTPLTVTATVPAAGSVTWSGTSTALAVTATRAVVGQATGTAATPVTVNRPATGAVTWTGTTAPPATTATPTAGGFAGYQAPSTPTIYTAILTAGVGSTQPSVPTAVTVTLPAGGSVTWAGTSTSTPVTANRAAVGVADHPGAAPLPVTVTTTSGGQVPRGGASDPLPGYATLSSAGGLTGLVGGAPLPITANRAGAGAANLTGTSIRLAVTATVASNSGTDFQAPSTTTQVTATRVVDAAANLTSASAAVPVTVTRPATGGARGASTTTAVTATGGAAGAVAWSGASTATAATASRVAAGTADHPHTSTALVVTAAPPAGGNTARTGPSTTTTTTATPSAAGSVTGFSSIPTAVTATLSTVGRVTHSRPSTPLAVTVTLTVSTQGAGGSGAPLEVTAATTADGHVPRSSPGTTPDVTATLTAGGVAASTRASTPLPVTVTVTAAGTGQTTSDTAPTPVTATHTAGGVVGLSSDSVPGLVTVTTTGSGGVTEGLAEGTWTLTDATTTAELRLGLTGSTEPLHGQVTISGTGHTGLQVITFTVTGPWRQRWAVTGPTGRVLAVTDRAPAFAVRGPRSTQ